MNLFEDLPYIECEHVETMTIYEQQKCETLANQLLEKGGWTGAQIEWLESIISGREDNPFTLDELTEEAEKIEREENLNRKK